MKRVALMICLIITLFTAFAIHKNFNRSPIAITANDSPERRIEDALVRLLFPYVDEAIKAYYGKPKQFSDPKILKITRKNSAQYHFIIKIKVTTFA